MSKAEIVFSKLAAKKKEKEKINPAIPATTAATAAAGGMLYSLKKPVGVPKYVDMPEQQLRNFQRKLKPGDVLLTGSYDPGRANPYQILLNPNEKQYHSAVYLGKGKITEMLGDMKKPRKTRDEYLLRRYSDSETYLAYRPKITAKELKEYLKGVKKNQKNYVYSDKDAVKAFIKNKIQKILPMKTILSIISPEKAQKVFGCEGKFCSNLASSNLPQRLFETHKSVAMPTDYQNPKHFEFVGELKNEKFIGHLPASKESLWRYAGKPALIAGGAMLAADALGVI